MTVTVGPKIEAALIDPAWKWGVVQFGEVAVPYLTLVHPTHGEIASLLLPATVESMIHGFTQLLAVPPGATKQ